ncbi:MAG: hypothetical protein P8M73_10030 [Luminiphilus sp.]|jgi:nucleoid-associated protein YgaU|nr:hypothetical protein [Luminiphilus sp.]
MKNMPHTSAIWVTFSLLILLSPQTFAQGDRVISSSDVQKLRAFIGNSELGAATSSSGSASSRSTSSSAGVVNGVYVVKSGDTLSEIMSEYLGDTGFNERVLQQVIVNSNKRAFRRGNPHWLMAGASLRMPTADDVMDYVAPGQGDRKRMVAANDWVKFP